MNNIQTLLKTILGSSPDLTELSTSTSTLTLTIHNEDGTTKTIGEDDIYELQKNMTPYDQERIFRNVKQFDRNGELQSHKTYDANGKIHGLCTTIIHTYRIVEQQLYNHGVILEYIWYDMNTHDTTVQHTNHYYVTTGERKHITHFREFDKDGLLHGDEIVHLNITKIIYQVKWHHGVAHGQSQSQSKKLQEQANTIMQLRYENHKLQVDGVMALISENDKLRNDIKKMQRCIEKDV